MFFLRHKMTTCMPLPCFQVSATLGASQAIPEAFMAEHGKGLVGNTVDLQGPNGNVWLSTVDSGGFGNNWRGFAKNNRLKEGDRLLFTMVALNRKFTVRVVTSKRANDAQIKLGTDQRSEERSGQGNGQGDGTGHGNIPAASHAAEAAEPSRRWYCGMRMIKPGGSSRANERRNDFVRTATVFQGRTDPIVEPDPHGGQIERGTERSEERGQGNAGVGDGGHAIPASHAAEDGGVGDGAGHGNIPAASHAAERVEPSRRRRGMRKQAGGSSRSTANERKNHFVSTETVSKGRTAPTVERPQGGQIKLGTERSEERGQGNAGVRDGGHGMIPASFAAEAAEPSRRRRDMPKHAGGSSSRSTANERKNHFVSTETGASTGIGSERPGTAPTVEPPRTARAAGLPTELPTNDFAVGTKPTSTDGKIRREFMDPHDAFLRRKRKARG